MLLKINVKQIAGTDLTHDVYENKYLISLTHDVIENAGIKAVAEGFPNGSPRNRSN
jgi:hypothetical protein